MRKGNTSWVSLKLPVAGLSSTPDGELASKDEIWELENVAARLPAQVRLAATICNNQDGNSLHTMGHKPPFVS